MSHRLELEQDNIPKRDGSGGGEYSVHNKVLIQVCSGRSSWSPENSP